MSRFRLIPLGLLALLNACTGDKSADDSASPDDSDADDSGADDSAEPETGAPEAASQDLCDRLVAGPASDADTVLALSAMHSAVRLFGPHEDFVTPDNALITALATGPDSPDLASYASALDLCLLDAAEPLGEGSVEMVGTLAWIYPGTSAVELPGGANGVVIDLRGLPEVPELDAVLRAAVAPVLAAPVPVTEQKVRRWSGFVDQVYSSSNVYKTTTYGLDGDELAATGAGELPLVVVTGPQLAPTAARFAVSLAMAGRAWIVGEDVLTAVGEQRWAAVGEQGVMVTASHLVGEDVDVPDTIAATVRTIYPENTLRPANLTTWAPPAVPEGEDTRESPPKRDPYDEANDQADSEAVYQADLIVAHGVLRAFYPYFGVVGDGLDARLDEVLESTAADREAQRQKLGRLGQVLSDGHMFFGDAYREAAVGALPVLFDHIDGEPVITQTLVSQLSLGDTITAVNGEPIADIYADLRQWHGGATEGYATDVASRELYRMDEETTYTVRAADGTVREESIEPQSIDLYYEIPFVFHTRSNGKLDDLGAPTISYLNLSDAVTTTMDEVNDAIDAAKAGDGLVIDMRGYPGVNHYSVVAALWDTSYGSPYFDVTTWYGPDRSEIVEDQYSYTGDSDAYTGPLVLLTSPVTVSAAENFLMMLVDRPDTTFVGRNSAGTNGNITGMKLPGGFYLTFTGMEVLFPDGSPFHGIGLVPDIEVVPTAQDYADGTDPELLEAIAVLTGG